ncbi:hypothetical protein PAPHI01_2376 [Pancytospora philotis]|nr:hypothetical protein PAPHI01_2376 [Pancytospora philotis]
MSCIFCQLQSVKDNIIYENETVYAIVDRNPYSRMHLLVIPKEHHEMMHMYDNAVLGSAVATIKSLVRMLGIKRYNVLQNNGHGQLVPHCHFHLVAADSTGALRLEGGSEIKMSDDEYKELVQKIKREMHK